VKEGDAPSDPPVEEGDAPTDPPVEEGEAPTDPPVEDVSAPTDAPVEDVPAPTDPPVEDVPAPTAPVAPTADETPAPSAPKNDAGDETPAPSAPNNDAGVETAAPISGDTGGDSVTETPTTGDNGKDQQPVADPTEAPSAAPTKEELDGEGIPLDAVTTDPAAAPAAAPVSDRITEYPSAGDEFFPEPPPTHRDAETPWPTSFDIDGGSTPTDTDNGGGGWNSPTGVISTEKPIIYIPPDNDILEDEPEEPDWDTPAETLEQMEHDRNVLIALSTVFGLMLFFSIVVAHQMLNNPDGCCASICRLVTRCTCCIVSAVCFPCRMMCCGTRRQPGHARMMNDNSFSTHDLELS